MFSIYDSDYDEMPGDPFNSIKKAASYVLADLPHEDYLYLIGTDDGIDAVVFQGQVYYPEASLASALRVRAEAAEAEVARLRAQLGDCWTMAGLERDAAKGEVRRLREAAIAYDNEHEFDEYGLKWGAHVSERAYLAFVAAFGIDENAAGG